jgi:hypothetical protein
LFRRLGNIDFQMEKRGTFSETIIFEIDFKTRGKLAFEKYKDLFKTRICMLYANSKKSGALDTTEKVYFLILGYLLAVNIPVVIAGCVSAIVAKQGLASFCKGITSE